MDTKHYVLIEHTADIGIRVSAPDVKGLFINAGLAVFDIIARKTGAPSTPGKSIPVALEAENLDELFVAWLNELLFISASEQAVVSAIAIDSVTDHSLRARVTGEPLENYSIETEIKAATYHQLKLEQSGNGWIAEVIFDV